MNSGYLHRPLALNETHSFERGQLKQEVITRTCSLTAQDWTHAGRGSLQRVDDAWQLTADARYPEWAEGAPSDGDYVNFGEAKATLAIAAEDWQAYTQLKLEIYADCQNIVNPSVTIMVTNDGEVKIPDVYHREGVHVINLKNQEWQTCVLDISNLPRDKVTSLTIASGANGSYMDLAGALSYQIRNIQLERNEKHSQAKGWAPQGIIYSHIGYSTKLEKTAIVAENQVGELFQLVDQDSDKVVCEQTIEPTKTTIGTFGILDFSSYQENGHYYLQVGADRSEVFTIGAIEETTKSSIWKSLNFIFCERCGCPVYGIHGTCHEDITAMHNGVTTIFNGGWHDAGDLSQQLVQTAEVTLGLFEAAEQARFSDPLLALRLEEEGEWGLDFVLKTRLPEGYRVTSAGITRWTDNRIGNMDDAQARIHNSPYDNFLLTGILAKVLTTLPNEHVLIPKLKQVVIEDYMEAIKGFEQAPFVHEPIFWEHTYSTSKSTYLATLVWTTSLMYHVTGEQQHREQAASWMNQLAACQETKGLELTNGICLKGMFYRDEEHKVFQHFNHQAREHLYAQAFEAALMYLTDHEDYEYWQWCAQDYGDYLAFLADFTAPYPMFASGIYREDEWQDQVSFDKQHLLVGEEAKLAYQEQLKASVKVGEGLYVKRFPVWFSFRGNNAIALSSGQSAAIMGRLLKNESLLNQAYGQLAWIIGKNPFGQSMMYGEGYNYPQQYSVSSGEMMGEMPVGIQTFGNEDEPYWPQFNNATYKEVWVGVAGKWLQVVSELMKQEKGEQKYD